LGLKDEPKDGDLAFVPVPGRKSRITNTEAVEVCPV